MFGILGWIVFGLIVGVIAKLLMPGKDPGGIIVTMLLGIVGAVLGGYAGRALGMYGPADSAGIFMSIFGAIVVLLVYRHGRKAADDLNATGLGTGFGSADCWCSSRVRVARTESLQPIRNPSTNR